jgi:hypothetical protein
MQGYRSRAAALGVVLAISSSAGLAGGQQKPPMPPNTPRMPMAPSAPTGNSITPALEGWFKNEDGSATILIGYLNRNTKQVLDIPVGPNNRIEPAGAIAGVKGMDYGQPTHFETGRAWGAFSITVPPNWGTKRLTWTLVANDQTQAITLWLNTPYSVSPYVRADNGNTPPVVKLDESGPEFTGPPKGIVKTMTATVSQPLTLTAWATDIGNTIAQNPPLPARDPVPPPGDRGDAGARGRGADAAARGADAAARGAAGRAGRGAAAPEAPITVRWALHRGPAVKFADQTPAVTRDAETAKLFKKPGPFSGKATTTATFESPGEYVLRFQANDASGNGGGGDQCCWTNVLVRVTVK